MSPIALLVVVAAACGGGGTTAPTVIPPAGPPVAPVYLVRNGKLAPVARAVPARDRAHLLEALSQGPLPFERQAGFVAAASGDTRLRLAEQVFTLTALHPKEAVTIDGKRYTRSDFEAETPVILVESPLPFAHVKSPLQVSGTANTFEATFDYDLLDASGKILAHHFVTATSGTGQRGTFTFTARFKIKYGQRGKLVVYEESAKDGSRIHQSDIPLTLEP